MQLHISNQCKLHSPIKKQNPFSRAHPQDRYPLQSISSSKCHFYELEAFKKQTRVEDLLPFWKVHLCFPLYCFIFYVWDGGTQLLHVWGDTQRGGLSRGKERLSTSRIWGAHSGETWHLSRSDRQMKKLRPRHYKTPTTNSYMLQKYTSKPSTIGKKQPPPPQMSR